MSNIFKKIKTAISDPQKLAIWWLGTPFFHCWSDESYLKLAFKANMGYPLDLDNPKTFSEKLQWLKLHAKKPIYTTMVDKVTAKDYIAERIGEEYIIPTLGVWDSFDDIDFDKLPDKFVLKCTHDSGGLIICKDKSKLDIKAARKKINKCLKRDYFLVHREWPYKDVPKRIIAEQYMEDEVNDALNGGLVDYKFYCFNGFAHSAMVCVDRQTGDTKFYFFDKDWKLVRINPRGAEAPPDFTLPKPACIDKMFELAEELSRGFPYLRVDFYEVNGKIYFGELTFFPASGYNKNILPEAQKQLGDLIDLSLVDSE